MKKSLALLLCFAMLLSLPAMAANTTGETLVENNSGSSTVSLTAEATQMTVTVPTILPAVVDAQGNVTVATDAQVQNHSYGPVEFNSIQAEAMNGWTLVNGSYDFTKDKVGAKNIAVSVDNVYAENGNIKLKTLPWVVNGNDNTRGFAYGLQIPAMKNAVTASNLAKVVFTVDWYEGGTNTAGDEVSTLSLDKDYITMYPQASETIHAKAETKTVPVQLFSVREAEANGVEWSSDNDNVTVENGVVTAHSIGESVVTASYNGLEASCRVKVANAPKPLQAIAFSKNEIQLLKDESETVLLLYNPDKFDGAVDVSFASDNDNVTVEPVSLAGVTGEDGPSAVKVTTKKGGESVVTATVNVGGRVITAKLKVVVSEPQAEPEPELLADYAVLYSDGTLAFQYGLEPRGEHGIITKHWSNTWEKQVYTGDSQVPWNSYCSNIVRVEFIDKVIPISTAHWFSGCINLVEIDIAKLDTSNVTSMRYMFCGCSNLKVLDVSGFNTSKVGDMNGMFSGCLSLSALDLSGWDTSCVSDMMSMFLGCSKLIILDISGFDTSNVYFISFMFKDCSNLTTIYVDKSFVTTKALNYSNMLFKGCEKLVGGNGTKYNPIIYQNTSTDTVYAKVDTSTTRGYFTAKP